MYKFLTSLTRILFKIFYKIEVNGEINLPENSGYMICSNHIHMRDPILIADFTKRPISFMSKKELIDMPIIGWILTKCYAFPVDREKGDIAAIKTAINILKEGNVMSMFPEGTRHRDGNFHDLKKGAAMIAIKAGVPIVPVRVVGNYKFFTKLTLNIGEPIYYDGKNKDELTDILYHEIEKLK